MATEVSLRKISSGLITFYSTYSDASDNAEEYDVISIYADLDEAIILKNLVDIYIEPGTVINYSGAEPTIYDKDVAVCNITWGGIIKNSYSGTSKVECIAVYNSGSSVNIECLSIEGTGDNSSSVGGACVNVEAGEDDNNTIYLSNGTSINVFNYGLFGNYIFDENEIVLKIGTGLNDLNYNYQYIVDPLLT